MINGQQQEPACKQEQANTGTGYCRIRYRFVLYFLGFLWGIFWFPQLTGESPFLRTAVITAGMAAGVLLDMLRTPLNGSGWLPFWWFAAAALLLTGRPGGYFFCALISGIYISQKSKKFSGGLFFCGFGLCTAPFFVHLVPYGTTAAVLIGAILLINFFNDKAYSGKARLLTGIFYLTILFWQHPLLDMISRKSDPAEEKSEVAPITALSALALQPNPAPAVAVIAGQNSDTVRFFESLPFMVPFKSIVPGYVPNEKYDLIFIEDMPQKSSRFIQGLAARLNGGGLLAMPKKYCNALPNWKWKKLPGTSEFAAASPDRELLISPQQMENNLILIAETSAAEEEFLPGTLTGALSDFHTENIQTKEDNTPENMFQSLLIHFIALALILELLALYTRNAGKTLAVAKSSFCYTVLSASVLLSLSTVQSAKLPLLPAFSVIWFFICIRIRTGIERFLSAAALAMAWVWYFHPGIVTGIITLLLAGLAYASFHKRISTGQGQVNIVMQLSGISAGAFLIWLLHSNDALFIPGILTLVSGYVLWITLKKYQEIT